LVDCRTGDDTTLHGHVGSDKDKARVGFLVILILPGLVLEGERMVAIVFGCLWDSNGKPIDFFGNVKDFILHGPHLNHEFLVQLFVLLTHLGKVVLESFLDGGAQSVCHSLETVGFRYFLGVFGPAHHDDGGKVEIVLELLLGEGDLPLSDHGGSLDIVEGLFVFNNFFEGLSNDRNDEIHKDHVHEEDTHDEDNEHHDHNGVGEHKLLFISQAVRVNDDIEGHEGVEDGELTNGASEDGDEVGKESRHSTIGGLVDIQSREALGEGKHEEGVENEELQDILDHRVEESHQEVKVSEHPHQVHEFKQSEQHGSGIDYPNLISGPGFNHVHLSPVQVEYGAQQLHIILGVEEVGGLLMVELEDLIGNEQHLNNQTHDLAPPELKILHPQSLLIDIPDRLQV
jgi:hypothetical protein